MKRPGTGLSGYELGKVIGKKSKRKLNAGYQVKFADIK